MRECVCERGAQRHRETDKKERNREISDDRETIMRERERGRARERREQMCSELTPHSVMRVPRARAPCVCAALIQPTGGTDTNEWEKNTNVSTPDQEVKV